MNVRGELRAATIALLAGMATLTVAPEASAYRPFDGTDAAVADKGELELEVGPVGYLRNRSRSYLAPVQVVNVGLVDRWELVLQGRPILPADVQAPTARLGLVDTGAFLKTVLRKGSLQDQPGVSIATEFGALLPTVNGDEGAGLSAAMIASERFGPTTFHLNLQAQRTRAANADGFVGLIVEAPFEWAVRPVAEVYFEREDPVASTYSALLGFIATASEHYAADAAFRAASVGGTALWEVRGGFTWAIPVF